MEKTMDVYQYDRLRENNEKLKELLLSVKQFNDDMVNALMKRIDLHADAIKRLTSTLDGLLLVVDELHKMIHNETKL